MNENVLRCTIEGVGGSARLIPVVNPQGIKFSAAIPKTVRAACLAADIDLTSGGEFDVRIVNGNPVSITPSAPASTPGATPQPTGFSQAARDTAVGTAVSLAPPAATGPSTLGAVPPPTLPKRLVKVRALMEARARRNNAERRNPAMRGQGFVNPYNFVPFVTATVPKDLGERRPPGHDRWYSDTFSGRLVVSFKTVTPLLTVEFDRMQGDLQVMSVRRDSCNRPIVSGSSIKGMLRSMYEQVTGSRLGIFGQDTRLSRRLAAQEALGLRGALVRVHQPEDRLLVIDVPGTLRHDDFSGPIVETVSLPTSLLAGLNHGSRVYAWLQLTRFGGQRPYDFWRARAVSSSASVAAPAGRLTMPRNHSARGEIPMVLVEGIVHATGHSFDRKGDERLIVTRALSPLLRLVGGERIVAEGDDYDKTVTEWRAKLDSFTGETPTGCVQASYVSDRERWKQLNVGSTMFTRVEENVDQFYPGLITRELYPRSPLELLDDGLRPAQGLDQLTAADRLFGWVRDGKADGPVAYRGQCRLGAVTYQGPAQAAPNTVTTWKLATLNSPKPEQARFYTRNADGSPTHGRMNRDAYVDGDKLAGHKVYLHQQHGEHYWELPRAGWPGQEVGHPMRGGEYLSYLAAEGAPDRVSVAIADWVPPGEEFETTLYFDNLRAAELGALLWVLDLGEGRYHRLGMGRPLGFGSLAVAVDYERSEVLSYDHQKEAYRSLSAQRSACGRGDIERLRSEFDAWINRYAPQTSTAVLAAARGTSFPVHYPRVGPPDNQGQAIPRQESYTWFVGNDRNPRGAPGTAPKRRALPVLGSDDSQWLLPFDPQQP